MTIGALGALGWQNSSPSLSLDESLLRTTSTSSQTGPDVDTSGLAEAEPVPGGASAPTASTIPVALRPMPQLEDHYDVLVVGGTPAGIAASLAAARRGARVLLIEGRPHLGGDIVYAMLNMFDVPARPGEASPVHGIFAEFFDQLGMSCDIDRARQLFEETVLAEPNITLLTRTRVERILKDNDRVTGAVLQINRVQTQVPAMASLPAQQEIAVHTVVDATDDASFAARAGAGYYLGRENANPDKRMQSAGLLFSVSGVDWNAVRHYVRGKRPMYARPASTRKQAQRGSLENDPGDADADADAEVGGDNDEIAFDAPARDQDAATAASSETVWLRLGGVHGNYAWERGDIVRNYKPRGENILFLSINFGRQSDGTVVLNTLNIVGVDGLDGASKTRAHREAVAELPHFIEYLRRAMPGFQNAQLESIAPELYIRETRHIHGHYALKVADIRSEMQFFDRVASASYPLDLHPYKKDDMNPFGPRRYIYTLPLRSLVPRKVDNVFVASRSLSATYSAAGSARVIPITMAAGEAAGAAAWLCARQNITPHNMMRDSKWVRLLQASLREWGADIGDTLPSQQSAPIKISFKTQPLKAAPLQATPAKTTAATPAPPQAATPVATPPQGTPQKPAVQTSPPKPQTAPTQTAPPQKAKPTPATRATPNAQSVPAPQATPEVTVAPSPKTRPAQSAAPVPKTTPTPGATPLPKIIPVPGSAARSKGTPVPGAVPTQKPTPLPVFTLHPSAAEKPAPRVLV